MTFVKENRVFFFRSNAPINPNVPNNKKDNLATEGVPSQDTMERLTKSHLNFKEIGDRAQQQAGVTPDFDLVGHSQIETDVNAKNNVSGLQTGTTKVPHSGQLPTVEATVVEDIANGTPDPFDTVAMLIAADATATRNNFLVKLSQDFSDWLGRMRVDVNTNTTDITTANTNITNLDTRVTTNEGNISTNTTNISNNTTNITTNAGNITTNATNISNNTTSITNIENGTSGLFSSNWTTVNQVIGTNAIIRLLNGSATANTYVFSGGAEEYHYLIAGKTLFINYNIDTNIKITTPTVSIVIETVTMFIPIPGTDVAISFQIRVAGGGADVGVNFVTRTTDSIGAIWDHVEAANGIIFGITPLDFINAQKVSQIRGFLAIPLV